jgi:hypothetical protein
MLNYNRHSEPHIERSRNEGEGIWLVNGIDLTQCTRTLYLIALLQTIARWDSFLLY